MLRPLASALVPATTAFVTCDTGVISLATDRRAYVPPARITLTIDNGSGLLIGFDVCLAALERREPGGWIAVAWPARVACAANVLFVAAGGSATDVLQLGAVCPPETTASSRSSSTTTGASSASRARRSSSVAERRAGERRRTRVHDAAVARGPKRKQGTRSPPHRAERRGGRARSRPLFVRAIRRPAR
jgi:hypothetical protein